MKANLDWPLELRHRKGAPSNLDGIDVFFDFVWADVVGHSQTQFPFGRCLALRVRGECPDGLRPALLLTDIEDVDEKPIEEDGFYAVVVNLRRYMARANADASAAYFGDSLGTGLTRIKQFDAISGLTSGELESLVDMKQSRAAIERWVSGNQARLEELSEIVATNAPRAVEDAHLSRDAEVLSRLDGLGQAEVDQMKALLSRSDEEALINFVSDSGLLPDELLECVEVARRRRAVTELERMLSEDLTESPWQHWFEKNDWVLGTEFVGVIDQRPIDVEHIADFLMQAYDGFLDLIEIKRPEGKLRFWADALDHGNYVPHGDLVKAITQASRYILEVEKEADSVKFLDRVGGMRTVKPRCVLIFGRSHDWNNGQREAFRILNSSYHSISILTFDHVLERAKRVLDLRDSAETFDSKRFPPADASGPRGD
jgi:Domain of unknown function (DUF4263)